MARALRLQRMGGRYHVTARGNERKTIFRDESDYFHFLELVSDLGERFGARVHAYALMSVCILCGALASSAEDSKEFRAARSVHLGYSAPEGGFFYNEVVVEQSVNGSYFMACDAWKKLATFRTRTGGLSLSGYYSFIEDFRRDVQSVHQVRRARFGNGWIRTPQGARVALSRARFTASNAEWESKDNINAGIGEGAPSSWRRAGIFAKAGN